MDSQHYEASARPTSRTLSDLAVLASHLGYQLHMKHLDDREVQAVTDTTERSITFEWDLTPSEQRSAIAHELGHAWHGHDCSTPRFEREADAWAADYLIDTRTYADLEREGHSIDEMADHFGVTERVVHAFREHCLQQLGAITYGIRHRGRFTNALARALAQ